MCVVYSPSAFLVKADKTLYIYRINAFLIINGVFAAASRIQQANEATSDGGGGGASPMGSVGSIGGGSSGRGIPMTIRRGPGRPRLRPSGPGHQGFRSGGGNSASGGGGAAASTSSAHSAHVKKVQQRPLPVPIRSQQQQLPPHKSSATNPMATPTQQRTSSSANQNPQKNSTASISEPKVFGFYTQQDLPRDNS